MRKIAATGENDAQARNLDGAEKGCRDGQQVGERRRARTKTYVTEAEPTRSPYIRPCLKLPNYPENDLSAKSA